MTSEWRQTRLAQLGRIVTGRTPPSRNPEFFGGHIPFVTPTDFDGRRQTESTGRYLSSLGADALSNVRIPSGAVMVSCIGSDMGRSAMAAKDCVTNQQINSIVVDRPEDSLFVYYNLVSRREEICAAASGSAQPILNKSAFGRLTIVLPRPDEQRAIAGVLGALDDKIEQNRQTADALERLTRATFRAWFVDFEPVKAKAAGADFFPSMPQQVFDSLPTRFVDSEIGPVPEGWEVKAIERVAMFLNGLALQKYPPRGDGNDLPVIKIAQLRRGSTEGADWANSDVSDEYVVDDRDLLFSWSGTLEAVLWFGGKGALNQHLFKVTSTRYPSWFCLLWIRHHLPWFRVIAASKATTMGHIKRSHLQEAQVVVPTPDILSEADASIGSLYKLYEQLMIENRDLATLRNYILPQLLSGQIRVEVVDG